MNKTFCVECGFKNVYEAVKPKFCAGCGVSFGQTAKASIQLLRDADADPAPINVSEIDLQALRRGITAEANFRPMKIGEVMGTADKNDMPLVRKASNLPDGTAIFNQNQKDVAPITRFKDIDE